MLKKDLFEKLQCPNCKGELIETGHSLVCKNCKSKYEIKNNIPILLPKSSNANKFEMDYLNHYQEDANLFNYFEHRECKATEHDERRLREYIHSLVPNSAKTILDVGSGSAWVSKMFSDKSQVYSYDISYKNIETALQNKQSENHLGLVGDALNPPLKPNSFDCIIASEVIEHIVEPKKFIENLIPLLKKGGVLLISTPYKEKIDYYLCIHCNRMTPKNAHLHSFDENILLSLFDNGQSNKTDYKIFGNKALVILRTNIFLHYLPFTLWKIIDKLANIIIRKQAHIIIRYKNEE